MKSYDDLNLYKTIKELNVIDEKVLDNAYKASLSEKKPFENVLLDLELISDHNLGQIISEMLSIPLITLHEISIPDDILHIIPEVIARKQRIIVFKKDTQGLHIASPHPNNLQILQFIEKKTGLPLHIYYSTEKDIDDALNLYTKDVVKAFDEIIAENIKEAHPKSSEDVDIPVVKIVDTIISYAYLNKASDIHIEPEEHSSLVRFRIDGVLNDIVRLPDEIHQQVVTRIKVLGKLRTDEHQAPQDGKIRFTTEYETLDIRVSVVPIVRGEKIVMRLLSEHSRQFSLSNLGLAQSELTKMEKAYQKPYGMILSTGPTGSGKTTTIYAVLKLINNRDVNIMTIEDPVEYDIDGVNQIQVNSKTNLTFANGLRSILRQDPNVILVGEIRDNETADIAVNAALTGHLVLSTVHTNDASTTIPRLIDMGIEPFLIASTINVIIAQRLVRKIHNVCKVSEEIDIKKISDKIGTQATKKIFGKVKSVRIYKGKGCKLDHGTGFEGRVGIFELLYIDENIRKAIIDRNDASAIQTLAIKNGMKTMIEDGLEKVKEGITTIEEVLRVTKN